MSKHLDDFRAEVKEKLGGLSGEEFIEANPGTHLWATYRIGESCAFCGVMRGRKSENKDCRGVVRVGLRR